MASTPLVCPEKFGKISGLNTGCSVVDFAINSSCDCSEKPLTFELALMASTPLVCPVKLGKGSDLNVGCFVADFAIISSRD